MRSALELSRTSRFRRSSRLGPQRPRRFSHREATQGAAWCKLWRRNRRSTEMLLARSRFMPQKQPAPAGSRRPGHATTGCPELGRRQQDFSCCCCCCCLSMLLRRQTPADPHGHRSFGGGTLPRSDSAERWRHRDSVVFECPCRESCP